MGLPLFFEPAPADYPNHLAQPEPERLALPSAWGLMVLLVLACLVPRALMALRIPSICPDGVLYVQLAQAIEAGDWQSALQGEMALNVYPVILAGLHRLGLDWTLAGTLWGVIVSSLVVLPLWGWIGRQFDRRVALAACLLYAVHPKAIEWSPEVMRDPTFWFFFTLAIYCLWRAVAEVRRGWFLAAGAAILLASLTRTEGFYLLLPLGLWTFWRFLALRAQRGKLILGAVLCVVALPLALVAADALWHFEDSDWTALRLAPLARAQAWALSLVGSNAEGAIHPMSLGRMIWIYIPTMTRGLSPVFALLMFGGLWGWRRVWSRRDHQALFYTALLVMGGIWVQLWFDRTICPRYAMPIVLMASPFTALGLLGLAERVLRFGRWMQWRGAGQIAALAVAAALIAAINLGAGLTSSRDYFKTRRAEVDAGRWLGQKMPRPMRLVGPLGAAPIVGFYAGATFATYRWDASDAIILELVRQNEADVVILRPSRQLTPQRCLALAKHLRRMGLMPVEDGVLPSADGEFQLMVRAGWLEVARQSTPGR